MGEPVEANEVLVQILMRTSPDLSREEAEEAAIAEMNVPPSEE